MRWRLSELLRESLRNMNPINYAFGMFILVILVGVSYLSAYTANKTIDQELQLRDSGSLVWVASYYQSGENSVKLIPADKCMALQDNPAVIASGGIGFNMNSIRVVVKPSDYFWNAEKVTPGAINVWDSNSVDYPLNTGYELAQDELIAIGTRISFGDNEPEQVVQQVLGTKIPVSSLTASLVLVDPNLTEVKECWVKFTPESVDYGREIIQYALDDSFPIARYLPPNHVLASPSQQWAGFSSMQIWLIAGFGIGLLAGTLTYLQRSRLAVYRLFGSNRSEALLSVTLQHFIVLTATYLVAVLVGLGLMIFGVAPVFLVYFFTATASYLVSLVATLLLSTLSVIEQPLDQLRKQ